LNVKSFNVKASHSCKVERINDEILFYLKSRWISENEAIIMLIESFFIKNFGCLKMMDNTIYDKVYNDFLILNR
jgi:Fe-S cluster assembly scaffold protein SufB